METKNIRAFKSIRISSQEKKKSIRVKVFVYYNIRSYIFILHNYFSKILISDYLFLTHFY